MSKTRQKIQDDLKEAMRAKDTNRLELLRYLLAAIQKIEKDQQKILEDTEVLGILDKLIKQENESLEHAKNANRDDLIKNSKFKISVLTAYKPEPFSEDKINAIITEAITETQANSMRDMGKVMGIVKPKLQGRADLGKVSGLVKSLLGSQLDS